MQVMEGIAAVHRCTVEVKWSETPYIPTVNAKEMVDIVQTAVEGLVGPEHFQLQEKPYLGAEDFSFMAGRAPLLTSVYHIWPHGCSMCQLEPFSVRHSMLNGQSRQGTIDH